MAKRLNWENLNAQDRAKRERDPDTVTISGAPDMSTIFGSRKAKKKSIQQTEQKGKVAKTRKSRTLICPECAAELTCGLTRNDARAALRKHAKKAHKGIYITLLEHEIAQQKLDKTKSGKKKRKQKVKEIKGLKRARRPPRTKIS